MERMLFVGHRGAKAELPENTLRSIKRAFERGAAGAEFDLQRSADGALVVLHDDTLQRTAKFQAWSSTMPNSSSYENEAEYLSLLSTPVDQLPLSKINSVIVGNEDTDTAALLFDALKVLHEATNNAALQMKAAASDLSRAAEDPLSRQQVSASLYPQPFFLAELKGGDIRCVPLAAQVILEACGDFGESKGGSGRDAVEVAAPLGGLRREQIKWIGFDIEVMKEAKRLMPLHESYHVSHPFTVESALEIIDEASEAGLDGVDFFATPDAVTKEVVATAHAKGLKVIVWEWGRYPDSDLPERWGAMASNGVDIFTSSMPAALDEWSMEQKS